MKFHFAALFPLLLVPAAAAGDYALLVKTADPGVAFGVMAAFEKMQPLDDLEDGSHHVLLVDDAGEVSVVRGQGDVGLLRLEADPAALLKIFAKDVQQGRAMLTMLATMQAPPGGDPQALTDLVNALFDFPKQIEKLTLAVNGDPEHDMDAALDLTPRADTGLARFVAALVPNKAGAPRVGGDNSLVRLSAAIDPDACARVMGPLTDLFAPLSGMTDKSQVEKWLGFIDGTVGFSVAGEGDSEMVAGMRDPQAFGSFLYSDEYVSFISDLNESNEQMEYELTPKAVSHRGVDLYRNHVAMANPAMAQQNPLMSSGEMNQFIGLAGNYLVATLLGGTEASAKGLVDQALDKKIAHQPIADGAVLSLDVAIAKIAAAAGANPEEEGVPNALNATLGKKGDALHIGLRVH